MTPVTPIWIEAPTAAALNDAGYETRTVLVEPEELGIGDDDSDGEPEIAAWDPPRPDGEGWLLHSKYWTDDASILAIWARRRTET
jgi:hypothetical protein